MDLKELGEFGLIERIKEALGGPMPDGVLGIGDDCAVLPQAGGMETLLAPICCLKAPTSSGATSPPAF